MTSCARAIIAEDFAKIESAWPRAFDRNLPITREVWDARRSRSISEGHGENFQGRVADELPRTR